MHKEQSILIPHPPPLHPDFELFLSDRQLMWPLCFRVIPPDWVPETPPLCPLTGEGQACLLELKYDTSGR